MFDFLVFFGGSDRKLLPADWRDSAAHTAGTIACAVLLLCVWLAALANARAVRATSATVGMDALTAWASPLSYWVLRGLSLLGVPR